MSTKRTFAPLRFGDASAKLRGGLLVGIDSSEETRASGWANRQRPPGEGGAIGHPATVSPLRERAVTLSALRAWLAQAPRGTLVDAGALLTLVEAEPTAVATVAGSDDRTPATWRERLWIVPAETRLGVTEVAEAIGRPRSWVYRHTSEKAAADGGRLPHRKLDGELLFVAGEIRDWIRDSEEMLVPGRGSPPTLSLGRAS